jgi:hypothetical protein
MFGTAASQSWSSDVDEGSRTHKAVLGSIEFGFANLCFYTAHDGCLAQANESGAVGSRDRA